MSNGFTSQRTKNFKYNHDGSSNNDYFFHTLRIATMLLFLKKKRIKNDLLILALLHNCLETTKTDYKLLINLFGKKIINEIKILTVNRKKQWSKIYKNNYYKKINNSSKNARRASTCFNFGFIHWCSQ